MRRAPALVCLLAIGLAAGPIAAAPEPDPGQPPDGTQASEAERKAAAKAEVEAARAAFSRGEYQAAIDHYEAAMAILPAPKLHYNIAVCHQRLSVEAAAAEDRTRERDLAVESYNRYLEQNPRAEDRLEVAEIIRELGGVPVTMPSLKPLFDGEGEGDGEQPPDDSAEPEQSDPEPPIDPTPPQPPSPRKQPPYPKHGRFGFMFAGGYSPMVGSADSIDAPGLFAIDMHGGGFIGPRRRFLLAAHTMLFSGATLRPDGFSFYGYSVGLVGQQTWVFGREGVQLSFGAVAALTGQGLNQREEVPPPLCSLGRGAQIAARTGGLLAPRFDLGILLGVRRRGAISLLVQPSFAVFGDGPRGEQCSSGQTPWTALDVRKRWDFQLWAGAGYSFRF
ncbi:MAG TPA: hypothetical protein VM869_15350 [Enhygromyxa sp.]|nr:hypothetical protein [Enhygromyxa sp.]